MIFQVITVGISVLNNFVQNNVDERLIKKYKMYKWTRLRPDSEEQIIPESHAYAGSEVFDALLNYVKKNPFAASAELNSLHMFEITRGISEDEQEIQLYSTDTGTGWLCTNVLYTYLKGRNYKLTGKPVKVRKFGWGPEFIEDALIELMDKLVRVMIEKKKAGYRVYVNATGGLKPESAFLVVASLLSGVDVIYYAHQVYNDIAILPVLPLSIKSEYIEYLRKLKGGVDYTYLKDVAGVPRDVIADLENKGLIEVYKGKVRLRKWIEKLLEIIG